MTDKVKLYVVQDYCGEYLADPSLEIGDWDEDITSAILYKHKEQAEEGINHHGGHVVELVEKPEPEVVTQEEANDLDRALKTLSAPHSLANPFSHLAFHSSEEQRRLLHALVNGYTVAKEKGYNVKVPHTDDSYFYKVDDDVCNAGDSFSVNLGYDTARFTEAEIQHYGLQGCERVKAEDDDKD